MVLESALLQVRPGQEDDFEKAFDQAKKIIASMHGFISLELQRCIESRSRYLLLVRWRTVEDHTVGFRSSAEYQKWKSLLHKFYDPFPSVEHYELRFAVSMRDRSNGYEGIAEEFLEGRGRAPSTGIGARLVGTWARALPQGATVIDLGCGSGLPITRELVNAGLNVYAVDASPSMVHAFRLNFPGTPVACEPVEESMFFNRKFDGVLSWGLMFLLQPQDQLRLIQRIAEILVPGGRLLFTSDASPQVWEDAMTGLESRSAGAVEYRRQLESAGLSVIDEYEDEGQNHYFDALKSI